MWLVTVPGTPDLTRRGWCWCPPRANCRHLSAEITQTPLMLQLLQPGLVLYYEPCPAQSWAADSAITVWCVVWTPRNNPSSPVLLFVVSGTTISRGSVITSPIFICPVSRPGDHGTIGSGLCRNIPRPTTRLGSRGPQL